MSDAVYLGDQAKLDEAKAITKELTRLRSRGTGDYGNALRGVAKDYKLPYGTLWSLLYRRDKLKTISHTAYEIIKAAYRNECEKQMRKLGNDITKTEQVTGPNHAAVRAAKALVSETLT